MKWFKVGVDVDVDGDFRVDFRVKDDVDVGVEGVPDVPVDLLTMYLVRHGDVSAVLSAGVEDASVCLPSDRKGVGVEIVSLV